MVFWQAHDDFYVIDYAVKYDGFIVTNDMFRDHVSNKVRAFLPPIPSQRDTYMDASWSLTPVQMRTCSALSMARSSPRAG